MEDETSTVDIKNGTEVELYAQNLFEATIAYLNDIRAIETVQLELLKMQAEESNYESKMAIYQSVALIISVLAFVAPMIIFIAVKTSMSGEAYIDAIAKKSHRINKEQRRAEKLILKLLPKTCCYTRAK